ncbi:hypothetical protein PMZ80_000615 [Knufia obscura]|uniref:Gfd2/YDR514C-like C-terminal domain-containing protein n=1 Tax=Knufia obscura TaxID=1635080 RepID=A0ABR0S0T2_9EURO|nr:hypothetical protein PMZ80_000615 [Knufia obscura]
MSTPVPPTLQQHITNDAVIICIDVEAHCRGPTRAQLEMAMYGHWKERRVCEVGVTILDTRHIKNIPLDDRGIESNRFFQPHEFGIEGAKHDPGPGRRNCHRAGFWPVGLAKDFKFGRVRWIKKEEIMTELVSLIEGHVDRPSNAYQGEPKQNSNIPATCKNETHNATRTCCQQAAAGKQGYRPAVFIYFARVNDQIWLSQHDTDLIGAFPNSTTIDIQQTFPSTTIARNLGKPQCSAGDLLEKLGNPTASRHNGGNDAFYELQAYLAGLCLTRAQRNTIGIGGIIEPELPKMWEGWVRRHASAMEDVRARLTRPFLSVDENEVAWPSLLSGPSASRSSSVQQVTSCAQTIVSAEPGVSTSSSSVASPVLAAMPALPGSDTQPKRPAKKGKKTWAPLVL